MQASSKKSVNLTVTSAYNLWAGNYDAHDNPMLAMVDEAFAIDPLRVDSCHVVELGCGTGRNVARVRAGGASSYRGFDQSPGMLEKARLRYPDGSFNEADIQTRLPLADKSVDVVFATLVFEHLPDLASALREAFRVLAPNGKLRILEIHPDLSKQGTKAHFDHDGKEITFPCYSHDTSEWEAALRAAGFGVVSFSHLVANEPALKRCPKLSKHVGRQILLDIKSTRPS